MKQIVAVLIIVVAIFVAITIALQQSSDTTPSTESSKAGASTPKNKPGSSPNKSGTSPTKTGTPPANAGDAQPGAAPTANVGKTGEANPTAGEVAGEAPEEKTEPPNPMTGTPAAPDEPVPELGHTADSTFEIDEELIAIYKPSEEELAEIESAKNEIVLVVTDGERRHEISRYDFDNALIEIYGGQLFQKNVLISIARSERASLTSQNPDASQKSRVSDQEIAARSNYHERLYQKERTGSTPDAPDSLADAMKSVLGSEEALIATIWAQTALEKMLLPRETADLPKATLEWLGKLQPDIIEKINRGEVRELPAASRQFLLNMLLSEKRIKAKFKYSREGGLPDWAFATIDDQPIPRQPLLEEVQKLLEDQNDLRFVESYFVTDAILSDYVESEGIGLDDEEFATVWAEHTQQYENSMIPLSAFVTMFMGFPNDATYQDWFRINQALIRQIRDNVGEEELKGFYEARKRDVELGRISLQGIFFLANKGEKPFDEAKARAEAAAKKLEEGSDFVQMIADYSESNHPTKGNFGKFEHKNEWMKLLNENLFYVYYCGHVTMSERLLEMTAGDVSEPIRFSQGWAILRIADQQLAGNPRGFDNLRERIQASMADDMLKDIVYEGLKKYRVEKP